MSNVAKAFLFAVTLAGFAYSQSAPSSSEVMLYSTFANNGGKTTAPGIFTETKVRTSLADTNLGNIVTNPSNFTPSATVLAVSSAVSANIATALSIIPLTSPASGVIFKKDAAGAELPVNSTLGPIFTERAETIGKGRFFIGLTHQNYHFTSLNGESLNGMRLLMDAGGAPSAVAGVAPGSTATTKPVTYDIGMDIRLSQDIAFLTYGVTNRFDVSLGLPLVHAAVAARSYNGQIYGGTGNGELGDNCWCVNTWTPGVQTMVLPQMGVASHSQTGFGDLLVRLKGTVLEKSNVVAAIGTDVRFPTGDEQNYLGVGAMSVKPFLALSLYSKPLKNGIVISPHMNAGWQFVGKSSLGFIGVPASVTLANGTTIPSTAGKDYLPDVFSWAVGTEIALGRHNTLVADILGAQIGWIHGMPLIANAAVTESNGNTVRSPLAPTTPTTAAGLIGSGRGSLGQYTGSFGYKARIAGNLVATFNLLVRFDNNGLTARVVPLYGLGYSF